MTTTEIENLASVPQNNLEEMQNLVYRVDDLVNNTFLHVTSSLPLSFIESIELLKNSINEELHLRGF